jgi:hypothetical protein
MSGERAFSVMQAASLKARPGDVLESPPDLQYREPVLEKHIDAE